MPHDVGAGINEIWKGHVSTSTVCQDLGDAKPKAYEAGNSPEQVKGEKTSMGHYI